MAKKKMNVESIQNKTKKRRIFDTLAIFVLACVVIASFAGFLILNQVLRESKPFTEDLLNGREPTTIMAKDRDGNDVVATQLSSGDGVRENITYDKVPQVMIDAFLSVEDSRFFKHNGFDLPRFIKSAYENLKRGGFAQGGSTLTMQMIDVSHGTTNESQSTFEKLAAKVQEIFLALDAESYLSKEEILMKYLNLINFGGPARGVQKGAQYYFGKDISEITLSEAAFLAGVINAPNAYNPYLNYENAVERRNNSLMLMKQHGYISDEEYQLALNTELAFQLNGTTTFDGLPLQAYIDYVDNYCQKNLGINIYEGDMIIYTTMNLEIQQMYDSIMNGEYGLFPENDDLLQSGSALIDVSDGSIAALAGGRNYTGDNRINFSTSQRQTGSSIKPFLDYTLAFEYLGWATDQTIADVPTAFGGGYSPKNQSTKFSGDVSIADAIAYSWNIPALKALQSVINAVGIDRIIETMQKLGLSCFNDITTDNFEIGMGIGGSNMIASPLEMAAAYAALANGGTYTEPYPITRIEFLGNSEQEDYVHEPIRTEVFSPQASYLMNYLLEKAVSDYSGTYQSVMKSPYQVATKTGTSDWGSSGLQFGIPQGSAKDKWTCSYTTKYSIATWLGYNSGTDGHYLTMDMMNQNLPSKLNKLIFDKVHENNTPDSFQQPSGVVSITHLKGVFDDNRHYAAPEGTPADLVTTGLVKSEFATLQKLVPDTLADITSFSAKVNTATKKIDIKFAVYPDAAALEPFDGKYHGVPADANFNGPKIFSKTAVFGPVVYKVEVKQEGKIIATGTYTSESASEPFNITPGKEATVCGFYGYQNVADSRSKESCVTLRASETEKLKNEEKPQKPEKPETPEDPKDPTDD